MASHTLWKSLRIFKYNRCIPCIITCPFVNKQTIQVQVTPKWFNLNGNTYCDVVSEEPKKRNNKRKIFIPKITLLSETNDMTVMTLQEAEKLARRRDLKLVKVVDVDTRTERLVYRLMKIQDFMKEDAKAKAEAKEVKDKVLKEDKTIAISGKIADHDLNTKMKSIHKMLRKRYGVRVLVAADGNLDKAKGVRDIVIENCKEIAKAVTKSDSAFNAKVTLRPIVEKISQENKKEERVSAEEDGDIIH
ncbi:uncharacterized protein LOC107046622 [Diachasma alloeum]|uniref:uncharacterized protein LOC107046622 n=1 Tax=Diachasma alloeum TaxID=454923 RepID=UPI0007381BBD|nr:uncharacterized protein LOC107046622 [Diachasma alloeum]